MLLLEFSRGPRMRPTARIARREKKAAASPPAPASRAQKTNPRSKTSAGWVEGAAPRQAGETLHRSHATLAPSLRSASFGQELTHGSGCTAPKEVSLEDGELPQRGVNHGQAGRPPHRKLAKLAALTGITFTAPSSGWNTDPECISLAGGFKRFLGEVRNLLWGPPLYVGNIASGRWRWENRVVIGGLAGVARSPYSCGRGVHPT